VPDPLPVPLLHWDGAERFGVQVAVTTRHGGVSAPPYDTLNLALHVGDRPEDVLANRARVAAAFETGLDAMVFARQVHGAAVAWAGPAEAGRGARTEADALDAVDIVATATPGLTLVILVADCLPMALIDPAARVLAVVHAGWRGTARGAVAAALDALVSQSARPERVQAFLGPAVCPEHYQVSADVRDALAAAVHPSRLDHAVARSDGPAHWLVDLQAANVQQLRLRGVAVERVTSLGATTADPEFFSDRARRPCGRFALLARLTD
jgi:polyphenol oxidase